MKITQKISSQVLTISPSLKGKGGIATVVDSFADHYEKFNHLTSTRSQNPIIMLSYYIQCILKLTYYLTFTKIKIVHIHGASYGSFVRKAILIYVSKLLGAKVIYHIHGGEYNVFYSKYNYFNIVTRTLKKVDTVIVLSDSWKLFFDGILEKPTAKVINNLVAVSSFVNQVNNKIGEEDKLLKVLFLGKIGKQKGVFDLLDMIIEHKAQLQGKILFILGGDGEVGKLQNIIKQNRLGTIVEYVGWVDGVNKQELLTTSDMLILPSYNEGLPISILEAMSYGMPILSTNVGGIPEVVKNGENGFLIEPGDKEKMFEYISYFISYPEEIKRAGERSLELVEDFYPENVIPKLEDIYKSLLA